MHKLKAFLSHSSNDKDLVERVALDLQPSVCIYDRFTFEEAKKTIDEITRLISQTGIFVFFISKHSLASEWVQKEILLADAPRKKSEITILPIIIDKSISHDDARFPDWLREYNIQFIGKHSKISMLIKQEIIKLMWKFIPKIEAEDNFFVGRNKIIEELEQSYYRHNPICIMLSGLKGIGRRSALKHFLSKKVECFHPSYQSPVMILDDTQGIDDFILGLLDMGFNSFGISYNELNQIEEVKKEEFCLEIFNELSSEKIFIIIEDNGCLVKKDRIVCKWFETILNKANIKKPIFGILSKYKPDTRQILELREKIACSNIPELTEIEIDMFIRKFAKIKDVHINDDDIEKLQKTLNGHPEQIKYAIELAKIDGISYVLNNSYQLADFNKSNLFGELKEYSGDSDYRNILALLARFEYIEIGFLHELTEDDHGSLKEKMVEIINSSLCEYIGSRKEYIRLNSAVKDIIARSDWVITEAYKKRLEKHIDLFVKTFEAEDKNLSDYLYSIREAIASKKIDISKVIPSHILKTIISLYDSERWDMVIELAERVLLRSNFVDKAIINQVRKYLCLSYVRSGKQYKGKFMDEVHKLDNHVDINFLLGFYYRLNEKYDLALEKLNTCLREVKNHVPAKRELVQVLVSRENYDAALELAKEIYIAQKSNRYLFQSYGVCILGSNKLKQAEKAELLQSIVDEFYQFKNLSPKSEEIYGITLSRLKSIIGQTEEALAEIDICIARFNKSYYPKFAKFDIYFHVGDIDGMEGVLSSINEKELNSKLQKLFQRNRAKVFQKKGDSYTADRILAGLR